MDKLNILVDISLYASAGPIPLQHPIMFRTAYKYEFKAKGIKKKKVTLEISVEGVRVTLRKKKKPRGNITQDKAYKKGWQENRIHCLLRSKEISGITQTAVESFSSSPGGNRISFAVNIRALGNLISSIFAAVLSCLGPNLGYLKVDEFMNADGS
ncbi:unnamed protein product [Nezara viridula]|uniref:Uncharacterized protein n=1 Tax=Nezara viridula TaxID=85310 RepID=A0A9P0E6M5_NEZVI|nr:unnamed protein product [Nezara viridula]